MDKCEFWLQIASIVVDGLAAGGAIAAIFIALKANKQNRTEMKMTAKIEERSANISLLDKRLDIIQDIIDDKIVSDEILYVIFDAIDSKNNQELHKSLKRIEELKMLVIKAEKKIYVPQMPDGEGGMIPTYGEKFEYYKKVIARGAATKPILDGYKELCDMNRCPVHQSDGTVKGIPLYEIENELKTEEEKYKKAKERFIDILRKSVRSGIQTISEENNK